MREKNIFKYFLSNRNDMRNAVYNANEMGKRVLKYSSFWRMVIENCWPIKFDEDARLATLKRHILNEDR